MSTYMRTLEGNGKLMEKASDYWRQASGRAPDFSEYQQVLVAVNNDSVAGVVAYRNIPDVCVFYTQSPRAAVVMWQYMNGWALANRHEELLVYLEPGAEARYGDMLRRIRATPANRYLWSPQKVGR